MVLIAGLTDISAQVSDTVWTIRLNSGQGQNTRLHQLIQTMDGNFVAAGLYFTEETRTDIWVIKFTQGGEVLWNKTYQTDTLNLWLEENVRGLMEISTGKIVVFTANQEYKHYLIFLNQEGQKVKQVRYIDSEDPYYVYGAALTADDKFLVAGSHAIENNGNWYHYSWYRKIDTTGNILWEKSIAPASWGDRFDCLSLLADGGFALAGSSDTPDNYDEILLTRINSQGDTLWTNRWGTPVFDQAKEILPCHDGGFIVAATKSYMSDYKGILLKLDEQGNEIWMQTYHDYDGDEIHSAKPTLDGGYIIAGEHTPSTSTRSNFWVMKTDQQGNTIKSFELGDGSDFYGGRCILQCEDGSYIAVGYNTAEGLIIKFSPSFGVLGTEEPTNTSASSLNQNIPNPFQNNTSISWRTQRSGHVVVKLFDITGREIKVLTDEYQQPGDHKVTVDVSELPAGSYLYQLRAGNEIETKKMMIIK